MAKLHKGMGFTDLELALLHTAVKRYLSQLSANGDDPLELLTYSETQNLEQRLYWVIRNSKATV